MFQILKKAPKYFGAFIVMMTVALLFPLCANAQRLDRHSGYMTWYIPLYGSADLHDPIGHYIWTGDWFDVVSIDPNTSRYIRYPITVNNGAGDITETHWVNGMSLVTYGDDGVGHFNVNYNANNWYNSIPTNGITYSDDKNNNPQIYIINNSGFWPSDPDTNDNKTLFTYSMARVLYADDISTKCYYNQGDSYDADWHWNQASHGWDTGGLNQGSNTIYFAGTDAVGNYTTGSSQFLYDSVPPYATNVEAKNVTTTGFDEYVYGVGDATSGVDHVQFSVWVGDTLHWYNATNQGNGTWCCHVPKSDFGNASNNYNSDCWIWDKAGNDAGLNGPRNLNLLPSLPSMTYSPNSSGWTNSNIGVTLAPVDLSGDGIFSYLFRQSADNGATWSNWTEYNTGTNNVTSGISTSPGTSPYHSFNSLVGSSPPAGWNRYDDNNNTSLFEYSNMVYWADGDTTNFQGGGIHSSSAADKTKSAAVTFSLQGTQFVLFTQLNNGRNQRLSLYIDGRYNQMESGGTSTTFNGYHVYFISPVLPAGKHVIKIQADPYASSGSEFLFDGIDACGTISRASTADMVSTTTVSSQGVNIIQSQITDNDGNSAVVNSGAYYVDKTPPTATFSPASCAWTNDQTVAITTADNGGSGVASTSYRMSTDGGNTWSGYTFFGGTAYVPLPQGDDILQVPVTDGAGNSASYMSGHYYIDKTAPAVVYSPGNCSWTSNQTVTITTSDAGGSGVRASYWRLSTDGGNTWSGYTQFSSSTSVSLPQGDDVLQTDVYDNAGNKATVTSGHYSIDKTAPTATYSPISCSWSNNVSVTISTSDAGGSGLRTSYWRLSTDGGNTWSGYTQFGSSTSVSLPQGDDMLQTDIYDNAGNKATVTSGHYFIDKAAPTANYSPSSCSWTNSQSVTITTSDTGGSGLRTSYWRLSTDGGNTWSGYTQFGSSTCLSLPEGDDVLQTDVYDNAGNKATITSGQYYIDKTAPAVIYTPNSANYTDDVTVSIGPSDSLSGIKQWRYRINTKGNWGHWTSYFNSTDPQTVTFNTYADEYIETEATDNAGNTATVDSGVYHKNVTSNISGTLHVSDQYYEDTDVTGAVDVSYVTQDTGANLTPSAGVRIMVTVDGKSVLSKVILCPANNQSWIPFKFHTASLATGVASTSQTVVVQLDCRNNLPETDETDNTITQTVLIISAKYTEPVQTSFQTEIPDTWRNLSIQNYPSTNETDWQEWRYEDSTLVLKSFYAKAKASMLLTPDSRITASKENSGVWTMRSGYGFTNGTSFTFETNYDNLALITDLQRVRTYFPEYNYDMTNGVRELEQTNLTDTRSAYTAQYEFKANPQSRISARLHFTPLWYPDGGYTVLENARDLWTPGGQINLWGSSQLNISGSVYDDWSEDEVR